MRVQLLVVSQPTICYNLTWTFCQDLLLTSIRMSLTLVKELLQPGDLSQLLQWIWRSDYQPVITSHHDGNVEESGAGSLLCKLQIELWVGAMNYQHFVQQRERKYVLPARWMDTGRCSRSRRVKRKTYMLLGLWEDKSPGDLCLLSLLRGTSLSCFCITVLWRNSFMEQEASETLLREISTWTVSKSTEI